MVLRRFQWIAKQNFIEAL
jgi:hypothetical protein